MSLPEINITITDEASVVALRMADDHGLGRAIAVEINRQNEFTIAHIQRTKLSQRGPATLGVRTGHLRRSVRRTAAVVNGNQVFSSIGTNVVYAGPHEFGFSGTVQVTAHQRKVVVGTGVVFTNGRKRRQKITGVTEVRAHRRKMEIPARAMFRTGIEERADEYGTAVSSAIINYAAGGKS